MEVVMVEEMWQNYAAHMYGKDFETELSADHLEHIKIAFFAGATAVLVEQQKIAARVAQSHLMNHVEFVQQVTRTLLDECMYFHHDKSRELIRRHTERN